MAFFSVKKRLKEALPEFVIESARGYLRKFRRPNLFYDDRFLLYVYKKQRGLEKSKDYIQTLALRGSIADYGFLPGISRTDYNLGLTSSDLYTAYHLYLNYRTKLSKLNRVIVYLNSAAVGFSLIRTSERYRAVAYKYFFGVPYQSDGQIKKRYENEILNRCRALSEPAIEDDYRGYDKKSGIPADASNRALTHLRENRREPDQLSLLVALRDAVVEDGRAFYVVIAPARADYKSFMPGREELFKKVYELEKKGFQVFDFYESNEIDDMHMADTDHLNEEGAAVLTEMVVKRMGLNS